MFDHSSADPLDLIDPPRRAAVDHSGPANARTCKKAIQKALKPKPSASGAKEQERQESSPALLDAKLQLCCAFIPGILADSHVSLVAKKLISAVSDIALTSGMVTKPVAFLTQKLGDTFDRKFLLRAKMNVASVLLDHEKKFLADLVAREHQPKDSNCKGYITALTWMWDETEQTASNVLSQLQTSLDPFLYSMLERLPLTKTYLEAKRRGASTSNVVMSTIVQQGELQVVDLMDSTWGQPLAKKVPILVPPCRLLRMTASTIKGVLDYWMPLTATKRTKLADSALYNLIIYVADGATANSLFKKHEVMESQPNTLAPSWLSTPAARSESDSDSDHEDDSHPSDDGAPHTSPGMNNDDDDDDDYHYPIPSDYDSGNPKSCIRKVKKNTRKRKSKLNRIRQIALKAKTETTHSNKSLKRKQLQKGSHSRNRPANDDDDSDSDGWHWVD